MSKCLWLVTCVVRKKNWWRQGGGAAKSANAWIRPHSATGQLPCSLVARLKVGNTSDDYLLWCWLVNHVHVFGKAFPCFDHRQQRSHSAWYKQRRHTDDTMFDVLKKRRWITRHEITHVIWDTWIHTWFRTEAHQRDPVSKDPAEAKEPGEDLGSEAPKNLNKIAKTPRQYFFKFWR